MFDDGGTGARGGLAGSGCVPSSDPWPMRGEVVDEVVREPAVSHAVAEVLAAVRGLRSRAGDAVTAEERAGWLRGLRQVADAAEVGFTEVLGAFDAHADGQTLAASPSTAAWCRRHLRMAHGDAAGRLRLARLAATEPAMGEALEQVAAGALRYEQTRQIARSVRCLDSPLATPEEQRQRAEAVELLATLATTADPAVLAAAGRRIANVVNPDGVLTVRERQLARRYLQLSPLLDGMTALDGLLDAEGAATLSAALAPLLVPAGPDDSRSSAQRRADALVEVATLALDTGQLPQLSGSAAAVDVVVTAETLARYAELQRGTGDEPPPVVIDAPEAPPTSAVGHWLASAWVGLVGPNAGGVAPGVPGGPAMLPVDVVAKWLCNGSVGRMVLGPDSVPLDLGRRQRLFTAEQRRALLLRDAGCRFPGCDRPPRYTDAHHVVPWTSGGATDLDNALLLCRFHHNRLHVSPARGGWLLEAVDPHRGSNGPLTFTSPDGVTLSSPPRGP